jgi:hypothetical protein
MILNVRSREESMATRHFLATKIAKEQGHEVVPWLWNEGRHARAQRKADYVTG